MNLASFSVGRFARDRRGVAAVEFALIAPILITFYFGMTEICQYLMGKRRVAHATSAIADLVTQRNAVTPTDLGAIKDISTTIMSPFPAGAAFTVRVTSVQDDATGAPKVDWSWPSGGPSKGAAFAVSTPLNAAESVIVSEVSYSYNSSLGYFISGVQTMTHRAELRPRSSDTVACTAPCA